MKKALSLMLVCLMLFALVFTGCASENADSSDQSDNTDSSATEENKDTSSDKEDVKTDDSTNVDKWDYSSIDVFMDDGMFPDGCVFYSDLQKLWGVDVPVPDGTVNIGYVGKSFENEYWQMVKEGLEEEAQLLKDAGFDVNLDIRAGQSEDDTEGQLSIMLDMIKKEYDAIIIAPITDSNLNPGVEQALEAGIPVIPQSVIFNDDPYLDTYIGVSAYTEGQLAAEEMAKMLGDAGGQVAIITGIPNNTAAIGRTDGFADYFTNNPDLGIEVVASENAEWDRMQAKDITDTLIKQYPDLKGIYCNNDTMAMGTVESLKAAGKIGEIYVGGTDATGEGLESIAAGELTYTVNNYPYYFGKMALEMAFRVMNGENIPERVICYEGLYNADSIGTDTAEASGWAALNYMSAADYNA